MAVMVFWVVVTVAVLLIAAASAFWAGKGGSAFFLLLFGIPIAIYLVQMEVMENSRRPIVAQVVDIREERGAGEDPKHFLVLASGDRVQLGKRIQTGPLSGDELVPRTLSPYNSDLTFDRFSEMLRSEVPLCWEYRMTIEGLGSDDLSSQNRVVGLRKLADTFTADC